MGKTLGFGVPLLQRLAADLPEIADGTSDIRSRTSGVERWSRLLEPESSSGDEAAPAGSAQTGGRRSRSRRTSRRAEGRSPRVLVMVPTRELCVQVTRDLHDAAKYLDLSVTSVYGGRAYEPQIAALRAGVDLVVGTPGRLLDLANAGHLVLGGVSGLVLDEADEMLDLGFLPDIERVLGMLPDVKQTMLFSATMPGPDPDPGALVHGAADAHPRRTAGRERRRTRPPRSSSTARTRWTRSRCSRACCRPAAAA